MTRITITSSLVPAIFSCLLVKVTYDCVDSFERKLIAADKYMSL